MAPMIGRSVPRVEDQRLLTGRGRFSDDVNLPGQAYAIMVRSPHAHARIRGVDTAAARRAPGVLAVLSGADAAADGLKPIPHNPSHSSPPDILLENRDGSSSFIAPHDVLSADKVRHVGEPVAVVVAASVAAARDAAELVEVDYEGLPAVVATEAATGADAPLVWDGRPSNVTIDADVGDRAKVDAAFARAHRVVRLATTLSRLTGVPMEPRAGVGEYEAATGRFTLHAGCGSAVRAQKECAFILGVAEDRVRVVMHDVGGNYGPRNAMYPEFPLVLWASRRVGRPVKWTSDRSECFLTDCQARDLVVEAELALDAESRFLAIRGRNVSNLGAHTISWVPLVKGVEIFTTVYDVPMTFFRAVGVISHTPPTYPYRAAGRPEVVFAMERLIDLAARRHGLDRLEIRRRNLVPPRAMPYTNPAGMTYDSGDFPASFEAAAVRAEWAGFEQRRLAARRRGRHRGIGIANYVDLSTGAPQERTEITVRPNRVIDVIIGTQAYGQGHETAYGQVVADLLQAPFETIVLRQGDTAFVKVGGGSHSGRSMRIGAIILSLAAEEILAKGKRIAAHVLEAAETDIVYADGFFVVAGTDRKLGLFDVAEAATRADLPEALRGPLAAVGDITSRRPAYGSGCHVAEVEVDVETGTVEIVRYTAVDDVGRAINPMLVDGQTHGGVAQGIGQALMEACAYDPETAQMQAATFMDYALPRADQMPAFDTVIAEVPTATNPLGVKPGSEGGTPPSPAAIINAIVDALAEFGVSHVELPATPERVWRAIRDAASTKAA
jgi:carbon-monoxide dehydrogenase large subunit